MMDYLPVEFFCHFNYITLTNMNGPQACSIPNCTENILLGFIKINENSFCFKRFTFRILNASKGHDTLYFILNKEGR